MDFIHQGWQPGRAGQQGKHKGPENNKTQHAEDVVKKRSYPMVERILTDIIKIHYHPSWLLQPGHNRWRAIISLVKQTLD
jgi:hypothetical protein